MNTAPMFSSATDDWATPQAFFDTLDKEFHFTLDVCASAENAKCDEYFDVEMDGLKQPWRHQDGFGSGTPARCWLNPPYGRAIGDWTAKAAEEARSGNAATVALVPARTDTRWFREAFKTAAELRFITGRLKFGDGANSAPFPSALFVFQRDGRYGPCRVYYFDWKVK